MIASAGNSVGARKFSDAAAGESWRAFDRLPPILRAAMCQLASDFCATDILRSFDKIRLKHGETIATRAVLDALLRNEREEIEEFAAEQGYLPHVAAGVSILRYGRAA
ncbi:hypothetical protein GXW78_16935 [Roseomonas terrae]|uniref:Uncharacterized protein n=1 Tax=Neoroseomonas terrae TaxID=424799 RepID=A0ABS5EK12_9PROT|nr:hypothetical protein [Neoroseomonas terrae]